MIWLHSGDVSVFSLCDVLSVLQEHGLVVISKSA